MGRLKESIRSEKITLYANPPEYAATPADSHRWAKTLAMSLCFFELLFGNLDDKPVADVLVEFFPAF